MGNNFHGWTASSSTAYRRCFKGCSTEGISKRMDYRAVYPLEHNSQRGSIMDCIAYNSPSRCVWMRLTHDISVRP